MRIGFFLPSAILVKVFFKFFCLKAKFGTVSDLKFAVECFICSHLDLKS